MNWIHSERLLSYMGMLMGLAAFAAGLRSMRRQKKGLPNEAPLWMSAGMILLIAAAIVIIAIH